MADTLPALNANPQPRRDRLRYSREDSFGEGEPCSGSVFEEKVGVLCAAGERDREQPRTALGVYAQRASGAEGGAIPGALGHALLPIILTSVQQAVQHVKLAA